MRVLKETICAITTASLMLMLSEVADGAAITLTNGETRNISTDNRYIVPKNASVIIIQDSADEILASIELKENATVTLKGVNIKGCYDSSWTDLNGTGYQTAAIRCLGNATIVLADDTTNILKGGDYQSWKQHPSAYPAINCDGSGLLSSTLTIKGGAKGNGKLIATGGGKDSWAPGIGAPFSNFGSTTYCGNIVIEGGDITAKTYGGKGIGIGIAQGFPCKCGNITIKDTITKVVARIGVPDGTGCSCGTISIGSHLNQVSDQNSILTITPMTYAITFNANGGNGGETKTLRYGIALGALPTPVRDDYDFGGWFTSASGGTQISVSTTVTGDKTYYAHWIDPVPELPSNATDESVASALEGSVDKTLSEKIKTVTDYTSYRQWIVDRSLLHKTVREAPNAWLSYALDAPGLMAKATPLASEDVVIESFEPSGNTLGAFDLVVDIAGAEIGTAANLAEVFGVEGATELDESEFSTDGFSFILQRTADGKARAIVTPVGSPPSFFLRVKVK